MSGYARRPFSLLRYLLVTVLFALGLMAKPMLVTLPFVLLLLDYWPLGRMELASRRAPASDSRASRSAGLTWLVVEKLPLAGAGGRLLRGDVSGPRDSSDVSLTALAAAFADCQCPGFLRAYLGQFFYPAGLAVFYPHPQDALPIWKIVGALLLLVGISAGVLACRRKCPYLLVGWFWYLGMLVPVIGLVQVGAQAMADRYTYLPQIGLYIALAWGAARVARHWPYRRWVCRRRLGAGRAGHGWCAWRQTSYWHDSETLWTHTLGLHLAELAGPQQPRRGSGRPRTGRRGHRPLPEGPGNQARLRGGPQQPRRCSGRPRTGRRGHRPLPEGAGNQARLRRGPQQPRHRPGRPRAGRRGHRPLPEGPGNQARLRRGPQQPRHRSWLAADRSTRPSPIIGRHWKSSPTTPRPTTTSAAPWPAAGRSTRPSPITGRPWKSSPTTPRPTYNLGLVSPSGQGAGRTRPSPITRRRLEIKPDNAEAHYILG